MSIPLDSIAQFDVVRLDHPGMFDSPDMLVYFYAALAITGAVVHILLSLWVYDDARRLLIETRDNAALVTRPWVWLFATLVGGIMTLAVYWLIHRSTLSARVLRGLEESDAAPSVAEIKKKARRRIRRRAYASDATLSSSKAAADATELDEGEEPTES